MGMFKLSTFLGGACLIVGLVNFGTGGFSIINGMLLTMGVLVTGVGLRFLADSEQAGDLP